MTLNILIMTQYLLNIPLRKYRQIDCNIAFIIHLQTLLWKKHAIYTWLNVFIVMCHRYKMLQSIKTTYACGYTHWHILVLYPYSRRGRDRMVVGFTTTYAISSYHHWCCVHPYKISLFACLLMLDVTFKNISAISWRSVLFVEETGVPGENNRPVISHWQTLSHNVSSTPRHERS
jgi:hypothetical protein